jgi:hypothetical protein
MHMPQSRRDYLSGFGQDTGTSPAPIADTSGTSFLPAPIDVSASAFMPSSVGPQTIDPTAIPYAGNFMQPVSGSSVYVPSAPSSPAPVATVPDTSGSWLTSLIPALTAGLNTYSAVELANNPNAALARMFSTPAGVTAGINPYGIPSGLQLPPGVTAAQYAAMYPGLYTAPPSILSASMLPMLLIGGGLLVVFMMTGRK